jgi:hypothetical protein
MNYREMDDYRGLYARVGRNPKICDFLIRKAKAKIHMNRIIFLPLSQIIC